MRWFFVISAAVTISLLLGLSQRGRGTNPAPASLPGIQFELTSFDAGGVREPLPPRVDHPFRFQNRSSKPVAIRRVQSTCGCTVADGYKKTPYAPGEEGELSLALTLPQVGRKSADVYVFLDDTDSPVV